MASFEPTTIGAYTFQLSVDATASEGAVSGVVCGRKAYPYADIMDLSVAA